MSQNSGTLVGAPIRPASTLDTFPTAYNTEILGGLHIVPTLLSIPLARREFGMIVVLVNKSGSSATDISVPFQYKGLSSLSDNDFGNISNWTNIGGTSTIDWSIINNKPTFGDGALLDADVVGGLLLLDENIQIPTKYIPASLLGDVAYKGAFDPTSGYPAPVDLATGWYYVANAAGTIGSDTYAIGDWAIYNGTSFEWIPNSNKVSSVNGKTGTVILKVEELGTDIPDNRLLIVDSGMVIDSGYEITHLVAYLTSYPDSYTSPYQVGGIQSGTPVSSLRGQDKNVLLNWIFFPTLQPVVTEPSVSITAVSDPLVDEIGKTVSIDVTINLDKGSYSVHNQGDIPRLGLLISYTLKVKDDTDVTIISNTYTDGELDDGEVILSITYTGASKYLKFYLEYSYAIGSTPLDSRGNTATTDAYGNPISALAAGDEVTAELYRLYISDSILYGLIGDVNSTRSRIRVPMLDTGNVIEPININEDFTDYARIHIPKAWFDGLTSGTIKFYIQIDGYWYEDLTWSANGEESIDNQSSQPIAYYVYDRAGYYRGDNIYKIELD